MRGDRVHARTESALPNLVVIGAMKCGTTALHRLLARHPDVFMAADKELDFFAQQWHRGLAWYASRFDAHAPVRGESSPGYTSPDHPDVAERMAAVVPRARLVYLVREPFDRALSQYRHHRREGAETRPVATALLDPCSQYIARSRYLDRLSPFRDRFDPDQLLVVVQERLRGDPAGQLARVFSFLGVPTGWASATDTGPGRTARPAGDTEPVPNGLREEFRSLVGDDSARLRRFLDDPVPEWPVGAGDTAPA